MSLPFFLYDDDLAAAAGAWARPFLPDFDDRALPLSTLADLLGDLDSLEGVFEGDAPAEYIYYTLMAYRRFAPGFFPVHDLCLLMGNMLRERLAGQGAQQGPVTLLDWGLLPVAVLLAQDAPPGGREFLLPPGGLEAESAERIVRHLDRRLPGSRWRLTEAAHEVPAGAWVLAEDPLGHCMADARFLERLAGISGGAVLSSWDFLGVRIHAHTRSQWLATGLMDGIVQLPRPRRQSATEYPAVIALRAPAPGAPLRLAQVAAIQPGPGSLDQKGTLTLLAGPPKAGASMELDAGAPARDGLFTLSPATWLTPPLAAPQGRTLRAFAQVLRCQLPRERLEEAPAWYEETVEGGELVQVWHDGFGEAPDGEYIAREVSVSEFDPMTGFVDEYRGNIVKVPLNPLGRQGKYLLRPNDIVFAFRGTALSVGKVGFVEEVGAPAITGQSMCIIRALPAMDPVWLYYYLQQEDVVGFIRSRASGSSLLTVNLESIRDIPVDFPYQWEINDINEEHRKISETMLKVARLHEECRDALGCIGQIKLKAENARQQERNRPATPQKIRGRPRQGTE